MAKSNPNLDMNKLSTEQQIMLTGAIKNATDVVCSCGSLIFNQATKLKKLSKLLIGAEDDQLVPIPALYCIKCLKELNLDEEKPKDNNEIVLDFKR